MTRMRKIKKEKDTGWGSGSAGSENRLTPIQRIRKEVSASANQFTSPFKTVFSDEYGQGLQSRAITFGEMLVDLSTTRSGRVVVSSFSLFFAWLLM